MRPVRRARPAAAGYEGGKAVLQQDMKNKQSRRNVLKSVVFLLILFCVLLAVQNVFSLKSKYGEDDEDDLGRIRELFTLQKDSVDVLFVGSSHVKHSVSPLQIYEETGVTSYNLGTPSQSPEMAAALLRSAFDAQHPKVVMLDVSELYKTSFEDAPWRRIIDNLPLSGSKLCAAWEYSKLYAWSNTEAQKSGASFYTERAQDRLKSFFSAVFPLYYYHSRWPELSAYDFTDVNEAGYLKGYFINSRHVPGEVTAEEMNEEVRERSSGSTLWTLDYAYGQKSRETEESTVQYRTQVPEQSRKLLEQMKELCEANGASLVLFKVPSVYDPYLYGSAWTEGKYEAVRQTAEEMDLPYLDLLYDRDIGYDVQTDSADGGLHCNYSGARKVSAALASYLTDECGLEGHEDAAYSQAEPLYEALASVTELEMTDTLDGYLDALREREDGITILIAGSGDSTGWLTQDQRAKLNALGLSADLSEGNAGASYAACIVGGTVVRETQSNSAVQLPGIPLGNGTAVSLSSTGSTEAIYSGKSAGIKVDGQEYAVNADGLNIVVYDDTTGLVIDSVAFSEAGGPASAVRGDVFRLLKPYEHALYERERKSGTV